MALNGPLELYQRVKTNVYLTSIVFDCCKLNCLLVLKLASITLYCRSLGSVCWGESTVCPSICPQIVRGFYAGSWCSTLPNGAHWRWEHSKSWNRSCVKCIYCDARTVCVSVLQQVMKDKWINCGYEGEDLKPHIEPVEDYSDPARIGETSTAAHPPAACLIAVSVQILNSLLIVFRGDGWDGLHFRGNQGLSSQ